MRIPISVWKKLFAKGISLANFLPYEAYDPETQMFILSNGSPDDFSVGAVLEIDLLPGNGITKEEAEVIERMIETIYLSEALLPDTSIQFILYASPFIDERVDEFRLERLERWEKLRKDGKKEVNPILKGFVEERKNFILKHRDGFFDDIPYVPKNLKAYVTYRAGIKKKKRSIWGRLFKTSPERLDFEWEQVEAHRKRVDSLIGALKTISFRDSRLNPRLLDAQRFVELMYEILNQEKPKVTYNPEFPINEQVFNSYMEIDDEGRVKLADKYLSIISTKTPPPNPSILTTAKIIGDLFDVYKQIQLPFLYTLNTYKPDQFKTKSSVYKRFIAAERMSKMLGRLTSRYERQLEDLDYSLQEFEKGHHFIRAYSTLTLFAPTKEKAMEEGERIRSMLTFLGFNVFEEKDIAGSIFLLSLPLGYEPSVERLTQRARLMLSHNVAALTPALGDWKGSKTPILLFFTRRGEIFYLDLFDSPMGYNAIVAAATGAGKSFFINYLALSYLSTGNVRTFIFDIGYSYHKICTLLGGDYITFSSRKPISLNPFSNLKFEIDEETGEEKVNADDYAFLAIILQKMVAGEHTLTQDEKGALEEALNKVIYTEGNKGTITSLYKVLSEGDELQQKLARMIFPYTEGGKYGIFFKGENKLRFEKDFTVLELEELRQFKDLQAVILLLSLFSITKYVMNPETRGERKLIIVDEAWDLLSDEFSAKFIETGYRIYRKYNASAISITQGIDDLYRTAGGKAAAENSHFYFLLAQRPESIQAARKAETLVLSDPEFELLRDVKTVKGKYSEIFIYSPMGKEVVRFVPDPFSYWLFTTKATERDLIRKKTIEIAKQNGKGEDDPEALYQAILELSKEYPKGL